jgi:hypothetical protein
VRKNRYRIATQPEDADVLGLHLPRAADDVALVAVAHVADLAVEPCALPGVVAVVGRLVRAVLVRLALEREHLEPRLEIGRAGGPGQEKARAPRLGRVAELHELAFVFRRR